MDKLFNPNLKVLSRFAKAFNENVSVKRTDLHLASKIRWNSFMKYMNWLQDNNFIVCKVYGKDQIYVLTEDGREMFRELLGFLECVKLNRPLVIEF